MMDFLEERLPHHSVAEAGLSGSQSVDRALGLLSLIGREPAAGLPLGEIVSASGLNKPTVRRLLLALMRAGLIEQEPQTRHYGLGEEAFVLGVMAARRHGLLDMAMEGLRRLAQETQDTSFLTVRRDRYAVCLHREEGSYPVRTHALQTGDQHPLGVGAGSLAILAALPDDDVDRIIAANAAVLEARYPLFGPQTLREDVAATRAGGFAVNPGRVVASSWGVGLAFRYPDGRVAGAFSLAAIDSRMGRERQIEIASVLRHEVARLEASLATMFQSRRPHASATGAAPAALARRSA